MRWTKFIAFNALGAALWVGTWSLIGYYSGNHIQTFLHYQMYISLTVVAALILYILFRIIKRQRERNA